MRPASKSQPKMQVRKRDAKAAQKAEVKVAKAGRSASVAPKSSSKALAKVKKAVTKISGAVAISSAKKNTS